jgi:anti-sigma factor RsiW
VELMHPATDLVSYLRGELTTAARDRVAQHLTGCPDCRETLEAHRRLLAALRETLPAPPAVEAGPFRAEVKARLHARGRGAAGRNLRPWAWPRLVPVGLTLGVAGALMLFGWEYVSQESRPRAALAPFEETVIGGRLELLRRYPMLERLDLLEDLDVIERLDRLEGPEGGSTG